MSRNKDDYDYDEMFPGRFLKAIDFKDREVTLKITGIDDEEMPDKKGTIIKKGERFTVKYLLSLARADGTPVEKMICLNKTNATCLKGMFGRKTKNWVGKRVTFYPAVVDAFGEQQPAIRVRGSPDISEDMTFEAKIGRSDRTIRMKRTGAAPAKGNGKPAASPPPRAPDRDDSQHEEPDDFEPLPDDGEQLVDGQGNPL